jgi:hypothetical protein
VSESSFLFHSNELPPGQTGELLHLSRQQASRVKNLKRARNMKKPRSSFWAGPARSAGNETRNASEDARTSSTAFRTLYICRPGMRLRSPLKQFAKLLSVACRRKRSSRQN